MWQKVINLLLISLILLSGCSNPPPQELLTGTVVEVVDGDTINIKINGNEEKVRLIGVDSPETHHPSKPIQPFGPEAENYTRAQLTGKIVYLELDVTERDRYGRLLAYVWLSPPSAITDSEIRSKMFNAKLLLKGYAQILTVPPNVKYVDFFSKYQTEARQSDNGLWGLSTDSSQDLTPVPARASAAATQESMKVVIESVDLIEEVVTIKNNGSMKVNLTGWKLVSETGSQTYIFPDGFVLKAGAKVNIRSGPKAFNKPLLDLKWSDKHIWNNEGDQGLLYDDSGNLI